MTEHRDLTGNSLHEPKGVENANANEVYIADGTGSGNWAKNSASNITLLDSGGNFNASDVEAALTEIIDGIPQGWGYYKDNGTSTQVFNSTPSKLSINGLDSDSNTSYLPKVIRTSGNLWNSSTNFITPISIGDTYKMRLDLPVTAKAGSPTELTIQLDIGGAATVTIPVVNRKIGITSPVPINLSSEISFFTLNTFLTNGGQIFISTDSGSVDIQGSSIFISRISSGAL